MSIGCLFLACKAEEMVRPLDHILKAFWVQRASTDARTEAKGEAEQQIQDPVRLFCCPLCRAFAT